MWKRIESIPWIRTLFSPVPSDSLVIFRVAFGLIMVWEVWRYWSYGWIEQYYIKPDFYFKYWGFEWVQPWAGDGMYLHFIAMAVVSAFIALGLFYRASMVAFFVIFTYIFLLDQTRYLNHFYLVILFGAMLIFVPANRAWSLDRYIFPKLQEHNDQVPWWAVWVLRLQMGLVYFYAGIAKINPDWLRLEPIRMWMADRTDYPIVGPWIDSEFVAFNMSYGGLALDLFGFPFLVWRRTRLIAFGFFLFFHSSNKFLFSIGIFPYMALAATTIFLAPDWPRKLWDWLLAKDLEQKTEADDQGPLASLDSSPTVDVEPEGPEAIVDPGPTAAPAPAASTTFQLRPYQRFIVVLWGLYFAYQILMPLRHFTYPGRVSWNESGHRFAWHMKLRSKGGRVKFVVVDPATGERWQVDPRDHLQGKQTRKMSTRPDMLLQFVKYLETVWEEERGISDVEIYANSKVSLNGRRYVTFVDPKVDLTTKHEDHRPRDWIVPLDEPLKRKKLERSRRPPPPVDVFRPKSND